MNAAQLLERTREFLRDTHADVQEFSDKLINATLADGLNYINAMYFLNESVIEANSNLVILPAQVLNVRQVLVNGVPVSVSPRDLLNREIYASVGSDLQTLKIHNAGQNPRVLVLANFALEFDDKFDISPLYMNALVYWACAELSQISLRENNQAIVVAFGKRFEGELARLNKLFYNTATGLG